MSDAEMTDELFTMKATLIEGIVTEQFARENPVVARTIDIKGSQTLKSLHYAIYDSVAFDEEHLYAFEIGGKKPRSKKATRYELQPPSYDRAGMWFGGDRKTRGVTRTKISSLELKPKQKFYYEFDFGDCWWWEILVVSIRDKILKGRYPKIINKEGEDPPQYLYPEDEWDDEE